MGRKFKQNNGHVTFKVEMKLNHIHDRKIFYGLILNFRWVKEKQERKLRLQRINERLRQGSICSTMSSIDPDNQHGSIETELSEIQPPSLSPSIPDAPPPTAKLDIRVRKEFHNSTPKLDLQIELCWLQIPDPFLRRNSAPIATTNSRPSSAGVVRSGSLGSSIDENDRTRIVGGGRHFEYPCGQCIIQWISFLLQKIFILISKNLFFLSELNYWMPCN